MASLRHIKAQYIYFNLKLTMILDQRSWINDLGSTILDQRSWINSKSAAKISKKLVIYI